MVSLLMTDAADYVFPLKNSSSTKTFIECAWISKNEKKIDSKPNTVNPVLPTKDAPSLIHVLLPVVSLLMTLQVTPRPTMMMIFLQPTTLLLAVGRLLDANACSHARGSLPTP